MSGHPLQPFLCTYSGGRAYPLGLRAEDIRIQDVAHALSQICRYGGHTNSFYSVAAHSLEVARRVQQRLVKHIALPEYDPAVARRMILTALLHDAGEAYLMDVIRPLKPLLVGYSVWEENVQLALVEKFTLCWPMPELIHEIDHAIVPDEVRNFFPPESDAWRRYNIELADVHPTIDPLDPSIAEQRFLEFYYELTR